LPAFSEVISAMHRQVFFWLLSLATFCSSPWASAADYSEFAPGSSDLSNNGAQPTPLALSFGNNALFGEASSMDVDILRVTVPTNFVLDAITITFHEDVDRVYAGLQAGPVWTAGTGNMVDASQLLGWADFPFDPSHGGSHTGEDILDDISLGAGSIGFVAPLESGVYTFMFQTASTAIRYGLNFSISSPDGSLPGDFNGDLSVNSADLGVWKGAFGATPTADANNDGRSDGADMLIWQRNVGLTGATPTVHAVPEPAAALLALGALAGWAARRRRR
jgi:hypothetical protein